MSQTKAQLVGPVLGDVNYDSGTLFVDSANNRVGIGTTTPLTSLTVYTTSDDSTKTLRLTDGTGLINIGHWDNIHNRVEFGNKPSLIIGYGAGNYLGLGAGGSERIRISADGNVGIGTTNPLAKFVVSDGANGIEIAPQVNSSTETQVTSYNRVSDLYSSFNFDASLIRFSTSGAEKIRITTDGKVGIGTTDPLTVFHIRQPADFSGITISHVTRPGVWRLEHSGGDSENFAFYQNNGVSAVPTYVAGRSRHIWYTDNGEKMQIIANGNVGIGTTNPGNKLHVHGGNIQVSGGVGIGTSPTSLLTVYNNDADASATFKSPTYGSEISLDSGNGYASLRIFASGTEKWRVGNVGSTNLQIWQSGIGTRTVYEEGGNTIWYTRSDYDASQHTFLQQNSAAYGRIGLTIRGKTHDGDGIPTNNDAWHWNLGRSILRYQSWMTGDTNWDTKFSIQHLMGQSSDASIGDLGILSKGFASGTTPAMVVNANGNVGIGTTNAATKLDVRGSVAFSSLPTIDPDDYLNSIVFGAIQDSGAGWGLSNAIGGNAGTGDSWAFGHNGSDLYLGMQNGVAADTMQSYMICNPNRNMQLVPISGNVGIGTSPAANWKLHVQGNSFGSNFAASLGTIYQADYAPDSTWNSSWPTIIADGALSVGHTYLVSVVWSYNGQPPYNPWDFHTSFLFKPANCNGGGGFNNTLYTPLASTHVGGTYSMSFRARTPGQFIVAGLAANLSWDPGTNTFLRVQVNLLAL